MIKSLLTKLKIEDQNQGTWIGNKPFKSEKEIIKVYSPADGNFIASIEPTDRSLYENAVEEAKKTFLLWSDLTAPQRGEIIRQIGNEFRNNKKTLGELIAYEMGKSFQESQGEIQEIIDICDFAVGLSRQLYGLTIQSERPKHRMYEQWQPLGVVGIISAFNFPAAVWGWNSVLAWVCGNVCIWKPSEKTPLIALACQQIVTKVFEANNLPTSISTVINGTSEVGQWLSEDKNINLVSATGSTEMGRDVGKRVAKRFGKTLLELGGNNAMIITKDSNLNIVIPAVVFGALGTAAQRCTSIRRLLIHQSLIDELKDKLKHAYKQIKIGNPLNEKNHMGPLIDKASVSQYLQAIKECKDQGGKIIVEGSVLKGEDYKSGCYVSPTIAEVSPDLDILKKEVFAPILYLMAYDNLEQAICIQNEVPQGLSSAIMTSNIQEMEMFLSHRGSDCGIANINIATSGAEIGGAFGGEKETGGGRESGTDSWKNYMRRQTVTINYSSELPLSQGIKFDL